MTKLDYSKSINEMNIKIETKEQENVTTMVEYKESMLTNFVNFFLKLFK